MPKRGAKLDSVAIMSRRKDVARLYMEGKAQWEIAKTVGVSQPMVSIDLDWIRGQWLESAIRDFDFAKSMELAKIDLIEEQMWIAYRKSCDKEVIDTRAVERELRTPIGSDDEISDRKKAQLKVAKMVPVKRSSKRVTKQLIGDTRYIDQIKWCIEMRCKILAIVKKDEDKTQINLAVLPTGFWESAQGARVESSRIEDKLREIESLPDTTQPTPNQEHHAEELP